MDANYRVTFAGAPIGTEEAQALDEAGLVLRASRGGGTIAPGEQLPGPTNHSVYLHADNGDEALHRVQQALEGHGPYVGFNVEPFITTTPPEEEKPEGPIVVQISPATESSTAMSLDLQTGLSPPDQVRDWRRRWTDAQRALTRLQAPKRGDLTASAIHEAQHDLHSFFVQTYHIKDALIADSASHGVSRSQVEDAISSDPDLALLADLANLDKHSKLDRPPRSGEVPVPGPVQGVRPGAAGEWRLEAKINHGGNVRDGMGIAKAAVAAWQRHLENWGLL